MKIARVALILLFVSLASILLAQTPVPAKDQAAPGPAEPLVVDAHASPYRATVYYRMNLWP